MRRLVHYLLALALLALPAINSKAEIASAQEWLARGDQYAQAGRLVEARSAYEHAISAGISFQGDFDHCRGLGLAWKNGEPHDYAKAVTWLRLAVAMRPQDTDTRLHFAQALAWGSNYAEAIEQYRALLQSRPHDYDLNLQLARTLSWSKRFAEAVEAYDELLKTEPQRREAPIERARVLSWAGRYDRAMAGYEGILASEPANRDARRGRAEILYWSGKPAEALPIVRQLLAEDPSDPNVNFLAAALEHNLGNDQRALELLGRAPADDSTRRLRADVMRGKRPVLRMGFSYGNDREEPEQAPASTYRTLRYTVAFELPLSDRVRMTVSNSISQNGTSTPVLSRYGADSLASETMANVRFAVHPRIQLSVGLGDGSTGNARVGDLQLSREHHLLYDVRPSVNVGGLRLDVVANRSIAPYTPLAVHTGMVQDRQTASAAYTWRKHLRIGGQYWHGAYRLNVPESEQELTTSANGGVVNVVPILVSRDRFNLEAGLRYELSQFADETVRILTDPALGSSGVFMPRLYQRYSGTAHVSWATSKFVRLELDGTFGPQRVFGFSAMQPPPATFGTTGTFDAHVMFPFGRIEPYIGYSYFSTATPSSPGLQDGSYFEHGAVAGLSYRF